MVVCREGGYYCFKSAFKPSMKKVDSLGDDHFYISTAIC